MMKAAASLARKAMGLATCARNLSFQVSFQALSVDWGGGGACVGILALGCKRRMWRVGEAPPLANPTSESSHPKPLSPQLQPDQNRSKLNKIPELAPIVCVCGCASMTSPKRLNGFRRWKSSMYVGLASRLCFFTRFKGLGLGGWGGSGWLL